MQQPYFKSAGMDHMSFYKVWLRHFFKKFTAREFMVFLYIGTIQTMIVLVLSLGVTVPLSTLMQCLINHPPSLTGTSVKLTF